MTSYYKLLSTMNENSFIKRKGFKAEIT